MQTQHYHSEGGWPVLNMIKYFNILGKHSLSPAPSVANVLCNRENSHNWIIQYCLSAADDKNTQGSWNT